MKSRLMLCLAAATFLTSCALKYPPGSVRLAADAEADAERVSEGKRLAQLMCASCHYDPSTKKLTGMPMLDLPRFIGKVYSRNITRHPEKGIGRYTDGQLAYLLRTGVAKDGTLMPYMQKPHLADEDVKAIIAFLRSDDELVAPSDVEPPPTRYSLPGKIGLSLFAKPLRYRGKEVPRPDPADELALGRYLTVNVGCYQCHSAGFTTNSVLAPERSKGYMGGGNALRDAAGRTLHSPNLTPHPTGLAAWDEREFIRALKTGVGRDGSVLGYPMPLYAALDDREASAIFKYLRALPPVNRRVKRAKPAGHAASAGRAAPALAGRAAPAPGGADPRHAGLAEGRRSYHKYGCVQCHGPTGAAIGDLRRAYAKYTDEQLKSYIGNAPSFGNPRMPPFADLIPDAEFPALIAYVKQLGAEAQKSKLTHGGRP